jgi:hypothetical protein
MVTIGSRKKIKNIGQINGHPFPQQEAINGCETYWPTTPLIPQGNKM